MNIKSKIKNMFLPTKAKRFILLAITLIGAIVAMVLGSIFYTVPSARLGSAYAGGVEYVVAIKTKSENSEDSKRIATDVALSVRERIDGLGVVGVSTQAEINDDGASVRVIYPGIDSKDTLKKSEIEKLITQKPSLVFTDYYGNPLFNEYGGFNAHKLSSDPGKWVFDGNIEDYEFSTKSRVPIAEGGAKSIFQDSYKVQINLRDTNAQTAWTDATSYIAGLEESKKMVIAWLNLEEFIDEATTNWPEIWEEAGKNPLLYAHVGHDTSGSLKKYEIDSAKFLISKAKVSSALTGDSFVIEGGNFNSASANTLARRINYGVSDYKLETISSSFIDAQYGKNSFNKAIIAGGIVFVAIAIFLILSYGVLGVLSTITIGLFTFLTVTLFTLMGGVFAPEAIAALIIGIGMSVDANIITFERLKNEFYAGSSLNKANKRANRQSFSSIFDANITTLIVAVVLFYFGTKDIIGLALTLMIAILLTMLVILFLTRILANLLINSGVFKGREKWLGMRQKFDESFQAKLDKPNYVKASKYFSISSIVIIFGGAAAFLTLALVDKTYGAGMNFSQEFIGGTVLRVDAIQGINSNGIYFTAAQLDRIREVLLQNGVLSEEIKIYTQIIDSLEGAQMTTGISVSVTRDLDITSIRHSLAQLEFGSFLNINSSNTTTAMAAKMVKDALMAVGIAVGLIVAYTMVRFKWTYSIAAIIAIVHDALIVLAFFVIFRIQVAPEFVAGLLSVIGYSINDTIVTFDRIRERSLIHQGKHDKENIELIANIAIKETIKRSLYTSLTTIVAVGILMSFGNATKLSFNLALLVGAIAGTYSSIFIATKIWVKLEVWRQLGVQRRVDKKFWDTGVAEEQTFVGINDFRI